jgi:hypothetical protein
MAGVVRKRRAAKSAVKVAPKAGTRPVKAVRDRAAAGSTGKPAPAGGTDYLLASKNRKLVVYRAETGETHPLNRADTTKVLGLLKQRQKYGRQITEHLKKRGFSVATARIIDHSSDGENP